MKCLDIKFFRDLKISMSKLDPTSCMTEHILSSPMPVSTHLTGNEESLPFESLLNSIKTKFQISMYLSPVSPSPGAFPSKFFPLSKNISEHGPHGPVSPIDQKLSSSPSFASLVEDTPIFLSQISSVTKGLNGCSKIKICLNTKDDTFLTSALAFSSSENSIVLDSSKYQSQYECHAN